MDISKKLKDRRKELNLTMLQVAQKTGVSEATISRWESGDIANMRRDKIVSLASALQVSPSFIMGWEDNKSRTEEASLDEQLSKEEFALFGEVHDLTEEEKKRVLDFIKFTKSQREE